MLRETPLPKSPTTLTNEQVEAWMRANPDRVERMDGKPYKTKALSNDWRMPAGRKTVKRSTDKDIKKAIQTTQRKTRRTAAKPAPAKRMSPRTKRRREWLHYLQFTGWSMTNKEVKEMFKISNPKFTARAINKSGNYITVTKELHNNRKTLIFRATKDHV